MQENEFAAAFLKGSLMFSYNCFALFSKSLLNILKNYSILLILIKKTLTLIFNKVRIIFKFNWFKY